MFRRKSEEELWKLQQELLAVEAENIPLDIVYEDDDVVVVNKPRGMVVHPAPGNYTGTMVNALLYHCKNLSSINGVIRPGIVHRIDKDTSGLLMVAKNDVAHRALAEQLAVHSITRMYQAVVFHNIKEDIVQNPGCIIRVKAGSTVVYVYLVIIIRNYKGSFYTYDI